MSLKEWFGKGPKGDWVDIGAPKKGGKYQACGRSSASKSKRAYPKCVPRSKAKSMTAAERKSAVARKRAKPQGVGGKPTNVATLKRKKPVKKKKMQMGGTVGNPDMSAAMGAGTMQQTPGQTYMQKDKNKLSMGMKKGGKPKVKVNPGMDALGKKYPDVANKILNKKVYAMGGGVRKVRY